MPDYSQGKIYTIRCRSNDTLIYVGCTTQSLAVRFAEHKRSKMKTLNKYINNPENNTNWDEWYIELYENCPSSSREELNKQEGQIIRLIGTINKIGYYVDNKAYREANRGDINRKLTEYYEANRDEINRKRKELRDANLEEFNRKAREYKAQNRDKINAQRRENMAKKKAAQ